MTEDHSSPANAAPPSGLSERIRLYLEDAPSSGGHSDAAGANCWELLQEAMEELLRIRAQSTPLPGLVETLRSHANDCENMERWATPELAPLLRRAADVIEGGVSAVTSPECRHMTADERLEMERATQQLDADARAALASPGCDQSQPRCRYCNGTGTVELTAAERDALSDLEMKDALQRAAIQPQCAPDREALVRAIQLSYARKDLEPTSATTLALYREDAENAADAVLALTRPDDRPDPISLKRQAAEELDRLSAATSRPECSPTETKGE